MHLGLAIFELLPKQWKTTQHWIDINNCPTIKVTVSCEFGSCNRSPSQCEKAFKVIALQRNTNPRVLLMCAKGCAMDHRSMTSVAFSAKFGMAVHPMENNALGHDLLQWRCTQQGIYFWHCLSIIHKHQLKKSIGVRL